MPDIYEQRSRKMFPVRIERWLAVSLLCFAASYSFAQKVTVEADQNADFSKFKTFSMQGGQLNSTDPALNSDLIKQQISRDIEQGLTSKGLTKVDGPADINVHFHFGSSQGSQVETYPSGWRGFGTRVVRVPFHEGTLVIDLQDAASKSLLWRGVARQDKGNADKIQGSLDDMVRKTLDKYPPKKK